MAPRKNQKFGSQEPECESCPCQRLIYWRDPQKSGLALGLGFIILLSISKFSLISVLAYSLLAAVCSAFGFRVYKLVMSKVNKTEEAHPFQELLDTPLPEALSDTDRARKFGESLFSNTLNFISRFRSLLLIEDLIESAKLIIVLWFVTYIGAWFNGLTLVILSWIGLFTLPKVYLEYQTEIDEQLDKVWSIFGQVRSKIPGQVAKED
ncbi:reticulon-1-A-like [Varroa jacobsoni]|uniref:Reticulon-like protein n=1 Tax=Varroa destructor TaxID=109461 RepID=A0A7M7IY30_VARDE|nr:reticulon-1-A-like [Varroa destructor]XP_022706602.1 reticulon-1-A-like [Varroa jacobsoni]